MIRARCAERSWLIAALAWRIEEQPMLIEIFRVHDGRLAEMWGLGQGLPLDVLGSTDQPVAGR